MIRTADGSLSFVPAQSSELSPSTLWLPQVDIAAFSQCDAPDSSVSVVRRERRRPRRIFANIAKMAAAAVLLVAVSLALVTPMKVDNAQFASLGISSGRQPAELIDLPGRSTAPVVLVLRKHADAVTVVDTVKTPANALDAKRYCLIVASLDTQAEAERFIAKSGDPGMQVLAKDGRYRVYAAEGATIEELQDCEASHRYPMSWICRR